MLKHEGLALYRASPFFLPLLNFIRKVVLFAKWYYPLRNGRRRHTDTRCGRLLARRGRALHDRVEDGAGGSRTRDAHR